MYKHFLESNHPKQSLCPLVRPFQKIRDHFYIYITLPISDFLNTHGLNTQKVLKRVAFCSIIAYCLSVFLWAGFNSDTVKKIDTTSTQTANSDVVDTDVIDINLTNSDIIGMKLDVPELIGVDLAGLELEVPISQDDKSLIEDYSIQELFAGQGGYDLSASATNYALFSAVPPEPSIWVKQVQAAGVYTELLYSSYRIREGDMIGIIAERFDLTQDTLISVNNIRQTRLIQIGDYIRVPSMSGILYTAKADGETPLSIAEKYQVSAKKTAAVNDLDEDTLLSEGAIVFVPDAFLDWVTRQEINGDLFLRPLRSRYYISSNFGWRNSPFTGERSFHNGIDMAAQMWTPIYGTLAGRVTTAKRNDRVYGNYVIVTHHSGYSTLYAHMIDLNVSVGQSISTNSVLGWVGSTGMSTGAHVHFSIIKYGQAVNPVSLWR